jgi:DNA-directed RNA polymerase specialized sigma24 family protein
MPQASHIAPHLPLLRRYARALTGSQKAGDAYVRATLEAVLARSDALGEHAPRVGLYRLFHVIWSGTAGSPHETDDDEKLSQPDRRLQALAPSCREALLLTSLEGFGRADVACILDKSEDEVDRDVADTQLAIEQQLASRVLIIEDESIIAIHLENMMAELGHDVVGIAATREDAVRQALARRPGLVLADVRLADGSSGIDAVADILRSFDVPVVFITAYPERLLTGERIEPTYLITKPFLPEAVKATVGQALFCHSANREAA